MSAGDSATQGFGMLNWVVLIGYLAVLVGIGWRCSRGSQTATGFFLANRRIPWWAAGLSIFGTSLSAITYLSVPARAYGANWTYLPLIAGVIVVTPLITQLYLPALRRLECTTAYEYLEWRFDRSIRWFGSSVFIVFQIGRMGIVVLLPAIALAAVTGLNVYGCILLMGALSTLYTVVGGVEAVVWTDVLQACVLLGGALVTLVVMTMRIEGGLETMLEIARADEKLRLVNPSWVLTGDGLLVIVLGALFTNALVPHLTDQALVQRYLTTPDVRQAKRAQWTYALIALPAASLFFVIGTGLYVYYQVHPDRLVPLDQADQILPLFLARELPVGVAGLIISGVFAASMSSLDSSMHSIATVFVNDFLRPLRSQATPTNWLKIARWTTALVGLFGMLTAMLMASLEVRYLWDLFLGLIGMLGGTLAGVFLTGLLTRRPAPPHVWAGILTSAALLVWMKFGTDWNGLLYGFGGCASCFLVAWACSRVFGPTKFNRSEGRAPRVRK